MYQLLFPFIPLSRITYVRAFSICCCSVGDQEWKKQGWNFWVKWGWKLTNGSPLTMTSLPQNSESWLCLLPQEAETRDNNRERCFPSVCGLSSRRDSRSLLGNSAVGFWQLQSHEARSILRVKEMELQRGNGHQGPPLQLLTAWSGLGSP